MNPTLFDRSLYTKVLVIVLLFAGIGLAVAHWYYGKSDNTDTVGTLISSCIVAYIIHFWMLTKKE